MKLVHVLCGVGVGLMVVVGTAEADRTMVVLLDATGSMTAIRSDNGLTRFAQSQLDAADRVRTVAQQTGGLSGVAVFKFFGSGVVPETAGFVSPFDAETAIMAATVTSQVTPLADAMCTVIGTARSSGSAATTARFLEVYSDGAENNSSGECSGPFSMILNTAPFDTDPVPSWQNKVWVRTTNRTRCMSSVLPVHPGSGSR